MTWRLVRILTLFLFLCDRDIVFLLALRQTIFFASAHRVRGQGDINGTPSLLLVDTLLKELTFNILLLACTVINQIRLQ